ncbi:MAG: tRNA-dihydrouridine synthase [Promethearchaeota archaeon]
MGNLRNPSILAAMAGITDGDFARHCLLKGGAGMVTIGGYSIGKEMITASKQVTQRGRKEFILRVGKEANDILREAHIVSTLTKLIINLRLNSLKVTRNFVQKFEDLINISPIIEINAHCRQKEILHIGGGQSLLQRFDVLTNIIKIFHSKDFKVSLKVRGNAVHPDILIPQVNQWQLDYLHIDSYKTGEEGTDLELLELYSNEINVPLIGNNSVVDKESAQAILDTGIQYFSVARAARMNPSIFKTLVKNY